MAGLPDFYPVGPHGLTTKFIAAEWLKPALGGKPHPRQPALLRALEQIATVSQKAGVSSGVCGESASDPAFAVVLAGMGFQSVSSSRSQVGIVRQALSSVTKEQAKEVFEAALTGLDADQAKSAALQALAAFSAK